MAAQVLIKENASGGMDFGAHKLKSKEKFEGFSYKGDSYKVKTFHEITRLEKNDVLKFESVPGTTVSSFIQDDSGVRFIVSGAAESASIVLGLKESTNYFISVNDGEKVASKTNMSGKLDFQIRFEEGEARVKVEIAS